jgi:hypothetical protein
MVPKGFSCVAVTKNDAWRQRRQMNWGMGWLKDKSQSGQRCRTDLEGKGLSRTTAQFHAPFTLEHGCICGAFILLLKMLAHHRGKPVNGKLKLS